MFALISSDILVSSNMVFTVGQTVYMYQKSSSKYEKVEHSDRVNHALGLNLKVRFDLKGQ